MDLDSRKITAVTRVKTAGIREGIATQSFSIINAATKEPLSGADLKEFTVAQNSYVETKSQYTGADSWTTRIGAKDAQLNWISLALIPTEWLPPFPAKQVSIGGAYEVPTQLPLAPFVEGSGWPVGLPITITYTFLGPEGSGADLVYRLSRSSQAPVHAEKLDGTVTTLGYYLVQPDTGRLKESDVTWIVSLKTDSRKIDYVVHSIHKLQRVETIGGG
jgi:hypothetical protein